MENGRQLRNVAAATLWKPDDSVAESGQKAICSSPIEERSANLTPSHCHSRNEADMPLHFAASIGNRFLASYRLLAGAAILLMVIALRSLPTTRRG